MNIITINKIGRILVIISLLIIICVIIYGAFTVEILFGIAVTGSILLLVGIGLTQIESL